MKEEEAAKQVPLVMEARDMLRKWEAKDKEVIKVWKMMNGWVYKGFDETYQKLGSISIKQFLNRILIF